MVNWKEADHHVMEWRDKLAGVPEEPSRVRGMFPRLEGYLGDIHIMTLYETTTLEAGSSEDGYTVMIFLPGATVVDGEPGDDKEKVMRLAQAEFQDWLERAGLQEKEND